MRGSALTATGKWATAGVVAALTLATAGSARAEPVMQVLRRLTPYDTTGDRSFEALESLGHEAKQAEPPAQRELPRFLHASASVDLWLIARTTHNHALEAGLARAYAVEEDKLPQALISALEPSRHSEHAALAMEGMAAVRLLADSVRPPPPPGMGSQLALAYLHRAVQDLEDAPSPVQALAPLGVDPCGQDAACEGAYGRFDGQGRAALAAFERAVTTWKALDRQRSADPLLQATSAQLDRYHEVLAGLSLWLGPRLTGASTCRDGACGAPARVDVVVYVDPPYVRVGGATRVSLGKHDEVVQESVGQPVWPEANTLTLPEDYPGYLRHLDGLVALLEPLRSAIAGEGTIGVATSDRTPAHVWARVVLSARAAHFETLTALAVSPEGTSRVQSLRVVTPFAATRLDPSDMDVVMLHRGYAVKRVGAGPRTTIDRVSGADGLSRFDVASLVKQAEDAHARMPYLRFVPNVSADALLDTAFALAPREQSLTLILP